MLDLRRYPAAALGALLWFAGSSVRAAILFTGATLHTASGPVLTNTPLLIRDGKIAAIGELATGPADETIELRGQHIFPGLIAPTAILGLQEIDAIRATRDTTEAGDYHPEVYSWMAVNPDSELIPVARANGYTHVEPIPLGGVVSGHSSVIALTGWTIEDLVVKRAAALHVVWPSFVFDTTPKARAPSPEKWKSLEEQVKDRDKKLKELDDFFTEAEAYAKAKSATKDTNLFHSVPAWEAMLPALRGEVPLFLHASEVRQIKSAIEWATRRKYRAVLAGGRDAWRVAELLATNHIPVVYEHVFTQPPRDTDAYDVQFVAPVVLTKAGVKVAFSAGAEGFAASTIRNIPYQAAQAMAFGLPREEALRGLTLYPAQLLGVAAQLGSLEVGKDATFFVADGDILDLRTHVLRLWIGGKEVSLENRHTRLYEKYRGRPKPGP
jgi:imidazolonepropionase-like amidohydrolase